MRQPAPRQLRYTPAGEEIDFRLDSSVRFSSTIAKLIFLGFVGALIYWSGPAVREYFLSGQITGAARHLSRFELKDQWVFTVMLLWCGLLTWWSLGSIYDLAVLHLQRDRFRLRSDLLSVQRRKIFTRNLQFKSYEPLELRLSPENGALEANHQERSYVLTNGGTIEDRRWLLDLLQQRYRFPQLPAKTSSMERIATYILQRRSDGTLLITSSGLSTIGCAVMAAFVCLLLVGVAVWLFAGGSGAGVIPLMFCVAFAFAGLSSLNRRSVEASLGKLFVRWSSPVGKLLSRYLSPQNAMLRTQFGEGELQRDGGVLMLKTSAPRKREPVYRILLCQKPLDEETQGSQPEEIKADIGDSRDVLEEDFEEELDEEDRISDPLIEQALVLEFTGSASRPAAEYILGLLSETTGFPTEQY